MLKDMKVFVASSVYQVDLIYDLGRTNEYIFDEVHRTENLVLFI